MKFSYVAYDAGGSTKRGTVEAASADEARDKLRDDGLFVTEMNASAGGGGASASGDGRETDIGLKRGIRLGGRKKLARLVEFSRQLSLLVSTGTPVADGLRAVERQTKDEDWKNLVREMRTEVESGGSLSDSMASRPNEFDAVARSLVAAGEASGRLDVMLARLASVARQQQATMNAVTGAMTYPMLLILICFTVVNVMLVVVVPRFEGMFATLNAPLPASTEILLDLSAFVRTRWYVVLGGVVVAAVGLFYWLRSRSGVRTVDRVLVYGPIVGPVYRSLTAARLARLLGVLIDAKTPLLESIGLVRASLKNSIFRELMDEAEQSVINGEPFASAFVGSPAVAPSLAEAIRGAEQAARLGEVLTTLADHLDEDNTVAVRTATSLIEPVILVVMGVVVGLVATSMFLPLFDLTASAGGGPA